MTLNEIKAFAESAPPRPRHGPESCGQPGCCWVAEDDTERAA